MGTYESTVNNIQDLPVAEKTTHLLIVPNPMTPLLDAHFAMKTTRQTTKVVEHTRSSNITGILPPKKILMEKKQTMLTLNLITVKVPSSQYKPLIQQQMEC